MKSIEDVVKAMIMDSRKVSIMTLTFATPRVAVAAFHFINRMIMKGDKNILSKRCYAKENPELPSDNFILFQGHDHNRAADMLEWLIESGIYEWWNMEYIKICSTTKIREKLALFDRDEFVVHLMQFGDRIVNSFVGWAQLLSFAVVIFLAEGTSIYESFKIIDCSYKNAGIPLQAYSEGTNFNPPKPNEPK